MKKYLETLHQRPVHQKREFAVHAAAGITAVVALIWVSTMGVWLLSGGMQTTMADGSNAASLVAATAAAGTAFQQQMQQAQISADTGSADQTQVGNAVTDFNSATVIGRPNDPNTAITQ